MLLVQKIYAAHHRRHPFFSEAEVWSLWPQILETFSEVTETFRDETSRNLAREVGWLLLLSMMASYDPRCWRDILLRTYTTCYWDVSWWMILVEILLGRSGFSFYQNRQVRLSWPSRWRKKAWLCWSFVLKRHSPWYITETFRDG